MKTTDSMHRFDGERKGYVYALGKNKKIKKIGLDFMVEADKSKYLYNFNWLGRPILQYPQDIVALQEIIWEIKPEIIVEMGIAHGGSLLLSASILELIGRGQVIGIDIDIREHNRKEIEQHPLAKRITLVEGSSTGAQTVKTVRRLVGKKKPVLVYLDSNHTHEHVLKELQLYSPLVTKGSYLIVFDTVIELLPKGTIKKRPWDKGNNPATAVKEFLRRNKNFIPDRDIENKLVVTANPGGFLKRIR